uniref:Uncharacterized protein n=1 Tax=Anabas testudineus TaxID=64144 RepID=A0A3Q1IS12_ANATE
MFINKRLFAIKYVAFRLNISRKLLSNSFCISAATIAFLQYKILIMLANAFSRQEKHISIDMSHHIIPVSLKIIIKVIVMNNINDLPKAMCILFGLAYALHLNYPKSMKGTFQFIQQVLLMLGHSELKPKLQTLKNPA